MRKPPSGVALTTVAQSPPLGGGTALISSGALAATFPCLELQPAIATTAATQARKKVGFMGSLAPIDHGNGSLVLWPKQRRTAASGNLRRKRLQAGAQLGIGDFAQALAEFFGHRAELRPFGPGGRRRRLA